MSASVLPADFLLGQALLHVMEENMKPKAGARASAPFFLVLLTDGKSQDDAIAAANRLKNAGVEIIAVGESERHCFEFRVYPERMHLVSLFLPYLQYVICNIPE